MTLVCSFRRISAAIEGMRTNALASEMFIYEELAGLALPSYLDDGDEETLSVGEESGRGRKRREEGDGGTCEKQECRDDGGRAALRWAIAMVS